MMAEKDCHYALLVNKHWAIMNNQEVAFTILLNSTLCLQNGSAAVFTTHWCSWLGKSVTPRDTTDLCCLHAACSSVNLCKVSKVKHQRMLIEFLLLGRYAPSPRANSPLLSFLWILIYIFVFLWAIQRVFTHRRVLCVECEWASAGRRSWLAFRRNCRSCGRRIRTPDRMSAGKPRGTRTPVHRSWPRKLPRDRTPYPRTGWVCWDLTREKESRLRRWAMITGNTTQRLESVSGTGQGTCESEVG